MDGLDFDVVVHAATGLNGRTMTRHQDMDATHAQRTTGTVHLLEAARAVTAARRPAPTMWPAGSSGCWPSPRCRGVALVIDLVDGRIAALRFQFNPDKPAGLATPERHQE